MPHPEEDFFSDNLCLRSPHLNYSEWLTQFSDENVQEVRDRLSSIEESLKKLVMRLDMQSVKNEISDRETLRLIKKIRENPELLTQ